MENDDYSNVEFHFIEMHYLEVTIISKSSLVKFIIQAYKCTTGIPFIFNIQSVP